MTRPVRDVRGRRPSGFRGIQEPLRFRKGLRNGTTSPKSSQSPHELSASSFAPLDLIRAQSICLQNQHEANKSACYTLDLSPRHSIHPSFGLNLLIIAVNHVSKEVVCFLRGRPLTSLGAASGIQSLQLSVPFAQAFTSSWLCWLDIKPFFYILTHIKSYQIISNHIDIFGYIWYQWSSSSWSSFFLSAK